MYTIACASAVRNSNKNLLLSGVFLPSRALAFLTLIKKGFIYVRGGSMPISLHRFEPPQSATRTKIFCSRARFTLSGACLSDTYKKGSYMFAAAVCNIPAPIRTSAVRNSNKNLLLSGALYPLGRLPFLTVIKRDSYISSAAVCNIPAPIRPSAVRNSNKNLLLSGALYPLGRLPL